MTNRVPAETAGEEIIALAIAAGREHVNKLHGLLDRNRTSLEALSAERSALVLQLSEVESRLAILEQDLDRARSSELAHDVVALGEHQRALSQQEARLSEQIGRLAAVNRRLRLAIRHNEDLASGFSEPETTDGASARSDSAWRVVQAQEEERQRLAREIHDGPAQVLANAVFELEFCERLIERNPAKLHNELDRLKEDIRQSLADVRHFIFGLRPTVLADLGLAATLRRYCDDYQSRCGISVNLEVADRLSLTGTQEVAIFRIIQEALQNARKHGRCSSIEVRLLEQASQLVITVKDDGEGFDVHETAERHIGHFGLRGMQERARLIGAELHIVSSPNAGTMVRLTMQCEQCADS